MGTLPNFLNHEWPTTREHERRTNDAPVQVKSADKTHTGCCNDIGHGGLGMTVAAPFQPGEHLEVEFSLPGQSTTLKTTVVVRWSDGSRYGCEFLKPTADIAQAINSYLALPLKKKKATHK